MQVGRQAGASMMITRIRSALLVASISIAAMLPLQTGTRADVAAALADVNPVSVVIQAAHFAEPLVVTDATTPAEDTALAHALIVYQRRTRPDDIGSLTEFLASHPQSGWAPALLTNLGLSYLH